jgi:hypothetical protein
VGGSIGEVLLDPAARYTDYVARDEVERLISGGSAYRTSKLLLSVLMLELWLSTYLTKANRPGVSVGASP